MSGLVIPFQAHIFQAFLSAPPNGGHAHRNRNSHAGRRMPEEHHFLSLAVDTAARIRYPSSINYETADFFHRLYDPGFRLVVMEEPSAKGR